jgi:hypothetical protein
MKYFLALLLIASPLWAQDDADALTKERDALEALKYENERHSEAFRFRTQRVQLLAIALRSRERALSEGAATRAELLAVADSATAVADGYGKLTAAHEKNADGDAVAAIWTEVEAADGDYSYAEKRLEFVRGMQRIEEQLSEHGLSLDEASIAKGNELSKSIMDGRRELDKEMRAFRETSNALEKSIREQEAAYGDLLETLYERVQAARLAPELPPTLEEAPKAEENTTESPKEEDVPEVEPEPAVEPEPEVEAEPAVEAPEKKAE